MALARTALPTELLRGSAHLLFHGLTGSVGGGLVAILVAVALLWIPCRRGERWAWVVLAGASLLMLAVKIWGNVAIYAPGPLGGLLPEVELPGLAWLVGMALSRGQLRGRRAQG